MSKTTEMLANNLAANLGLLKNTLADFSDADMMVRPVDSANHAAWQIGHLLKFETTVCGMYNAPHAPKLPDNAKTLYGKEGAKSDDKGSFMRKDEALALLAQARAGIIEWVKGLSDEDLQKPGPEAFRSFASTVGDLILMVLGHTTMHLGQFQVIRRKLGKPILF